MSGAEILRTDPEAPDPQVLTRVARALADGEVVAFPTDTIYGLSADATDPGAPERLAALKGHRRPRPFVVLFDGSRKWLDRMALPRENAVRELIRRHWPGPLTLVLRASGDAPAHLVSEEGGIALRAPAHPLTRGVLDALGRPVLSTSANVAGETPYADPGALARGLGDRLGVIVDGGPVTAVASTIVNAMGPRPVLIRRGTIDDPAWDEEADSR